MGTFTFISTKIGLQKESDATSKPWIRVPPPIKPYDCNVDPDDGLHDVASLLRKLTYRVKVSVGLPSSALLTVASLLDTCAGSIWSTRTFYRRTGRTNQVNCSAIDAGDTIYNILRRRWVRPTTESHVEWESKIEREKGYVGIVAWKSCSWRLPLRRWLPWAVVLVVKQRLCSFIPSSIHRIIHLPM